MTTGVSFAVAASVVSLVCGSIAFCFLYRIVAEHAGAWVATTVTTALSAFPAAPAFQLAYTESTCLLLLTLVFWSLNRRQHGTALASIVLLGLTRPVVIALVPVLIWRWRQQREDRTWSAVLLVVSIASFALWPTVCAVVTGRADGYLASQASWLTDNRSWLARSLADPAIIVVIVTALSAALYALLRRSARLWPTDLRVWAGGYFCYLIVATRPTSSIFRYAMISAVPWWPAPELTSHSYRGRVLILSGIVGFGIVTKIVWVQWCMLPTMGSVNYA